MEEVYLYLQTHFDITHKDWEIISSKMFVQQFKKKKLSYIRGTRKIIFHFYQKEY